MNATSPAPVTRNAAVECEDCIHLRVAPYQAKRTGCYFPGNMPQKQKERSLDEQQIPGDHERINRYGDCPDFARKPDEKPLWRRLLG